MKHQIFKEYGLWYFIFHVAGSSVSYTFPFDSWQDAVDFFNWSVQNGWPFSE